MEEEFIRNQERLKPQEERNEEERYTWFLIVLMLPYATTFFLDPR